MTRSIRSGFTLAAAALVVLALIPGGARALPSNTPDAGVFQAVGGSVNAIAHGNGLTYIGGNFTQLSARTGPSVGFNTSNGRRIAPVAEVTGGSGDVRASAPDGQGGYFIGGNFTHVGGEPRLNIAHILADGSVDPAFAPNANGQVLALAVSGNDVYVGGEFNSPGGVAPSIGGQPRNRIAKLSATSGNAFSAFDPNADGFVLALAISGSDVYVGGTFDNIGGEPRSKIAKLSASSGNAFSAFDPDVNSGAVGGQVEALAVSGNDVYVGGNFINIGGEPRKSIAKLYAPTGNAFSGFNPDSNSNVSALAVADGAVYAGGQFTNIGGEDRNHIAKLSATAGNSFVGFNPNASSSVFTLAVSGGVVYAGGFFSSIGGRDRNRIAKLSASSGNAFSAFDPNATGGGVFTLALPGSAVYAGGGFNTVNPVTRNRLAALDSTGAPTDFNPNLNDTVNAIEVDGTDVYVGGEFSNVGGQPRKLVAKLYAPTGNAFSAWDPFAPADGDGFNVQALAVDGGALYAGGNFSKVGGRSRAGMAKLATTSGNAFSGFDARLQSSGVPIASAIDVAGDGTVYAGGSFDQGIGGQDDQRLVARLSPTTGNAFQSFNAHALGAVVRTLVLDGASLYVGGSFTRMGGPEAESDNDGQLRTNMARLSATTGNASSTFDPTANFDVKSIAVDGSTVFAGGLFTDIGGQPRNRLAALFAGSGNAFGAFNPDLNAQVRALSLSGNTLHVGGDFTTVGGRDRGRYAQFAP